MSDPAPPAPRRYFPSWYERMNPLVADAGKNTAFVLFRERATWQDLVVPVLEVLGWAARVAVVVVVVPLLAMGVRLLLTGQFLQLGLRVGFILVLLAALPIGRRVLRAIYSAGGPRRRPRSLRAVFRQGAMEVGDARELFSTQITGPEVSRGLFLEELAFAPWQVLIPALVLLLALLLAFSGFLPLVSLDGLLFGLVAAWLAWRLVPIAVIAQAEFALRRVARNSQASYLNVTQGVLTANLVELARSLLQRLKALAASFGVLCLVVMILFLIFNQGAHFVRTRWLGEAGLYGGTLIACGLMLIGAAAAHFAFRWRLRRLMESGPPLLEEAGIMFESAAEILGENDHDTFMAARARCQALLGQRRRSLLTSAPEQLL